MMNKIENITLENGLKIILNKNKKHRTTAQIFIKAGGLDTNFILNNKEITVPLGTAHALEHYLIEQSRYGNTNEIFSDDYIDSNGYTSYHKTEYYISTVHSFTKNLKKLITIVNKPIFKQKNLDQIKNPIIQEIKKTKDRRERLFYKTLMENTTKNRIYETTLGSEEDIMILNINNLKLYHEAFYQPNNQIIVITGKIPNNIIEIIKKEYEKIKINKTKKIKYKEQDNVIKEKEEIIDKSINEDVFEMMYKINISKYNPLEKDKIDYYFHYLLETKFGEQSETFDYLIKNKYTLYTIETYYDPTTIENYALLSLKVYTSEFDKVIKILKEKTNTEELTEKTFKIWQNKLVVKRIVELENDRWISNNYVTNILLYNLENYDDIKFIKSLNLEECIKMINELDLSNITTVINKEETNLNS